MPNSTSSEETTLGRDQSTVRQRTPPADFPSFSQETGFPVLFLSVSDIRWILPSPNVNAAHCQVRSSDPFWRLRGRSSIWRAAEEGLQDQAAGTAFSTPHHFVRACRRSHLP